MAAPTYKSWLKKNTPKGSAKPTAAKKAAYQRATGRPKAGATLAVADKNPNDKLYKAAYRELDRQQSLADARLARRQETQRAFDTWVTQQRGSATNHLTSAFAEANKAAKANQAQVVGATNEAARQAGQSGADALQQSGANANQAALGAYAQADQLYAGNPAYTQARAHELDANQAKVDQARAANMMREWNLMHGSESETVNQARNEKMSEEVTNRQKWESSKAEAELNQRLADWTMETDRAELDIKRTNAVTERMKVTNAATAAKRSDQLKAQIAAGNLSFKQAAKQLDVEMKKAGLSIQERKLQLEVLKFQAQGGKGADLPKVQKAGQSVVDKYLKATGVASVEDIRGGNDNGGAIRISLGRQVIASMKAAYPNLTKSQALSLLNGFGFGAGTRPPTKDRRLLKYLNMLPGA